MPGRLRPERDETEDLAAHDPLAPERTASLIPDAALPAPFLSTFRSTRLRLDSIWRSFPITLGVRPLGW